MLEIEGILSEARQRLLKHHLYGLLSGPDAVRHFMRHHVFCVWDFQCLIKALQKRLTCVEVPWFPTSDPEARRLVNEIVLDEESDEDGKGGYASHFELYLEAMRDAGADTVPIQTFLDSLHEGATWCEAFGHANVSPTNPAVVGFVGNTMELIASGEVHQVAAAFALGREDVIPEMFQRVVAGLAQQAPEHFERFRYYLERHITTDAERHGPMAKRVLARLCGEDPKRWTEAEQAARAALGARLVLWDEIASSLSPRNHS